MRGLSYRPLHPCSLVWSINAHSKSNYTLFAKMRNFGTAYSDKPRSQVFSITTYKSSYHSLPINRQKHFMPV